jgi:DNA gyrase/topoisomerase IV subunit B
MRERAFLNKNIHIRKLRTLWRRDNSIMKGGMSAYVEYLNRNRNRVI